MTVDSPSAGADAAERGSGPQQHVPVPGQAPAPVPAHGGAHCSHCGSPMAAGQEWCVQCGAGAPGSLSGPGWRSAGATLAAVALLVLAAAVAGYAALNRSPRKAAVVTRTVAAAPVAPAASPAAPVTPATPVTPGSQSAIPAVPVKPPKIPLTAATPKAATTTPATPTTTTPTTPASKTTPAPSGSEGTGSGEGSKPAALVLDTNAASTYNPYNLPASDFGDPSLAIDGDTTTGWTAQVEPATAPVMAEGLLIDLRIAQKLSAVELITSTPGMTIQVYGANGATAPSSITAPGGWTRLTHSIVLHKRHAHLKLRYPKREFRWLTVWISKAPAAAIGTPQAPGHVTLDEVELFPPS